MRSLYESITQYRFTRHEIDESILDNDKDVKKDIQLNSHIMLAHELVKRLERSKNPVASSQGTVVDMYGRELHVGDIVLTDGSYITSIIEPQVIVEIDSTCTINYNPYKKKKEKILTYKGCAGRLMKLIDPEKYLK